MKKLGLILCGFLMILTLPFLLASCGSNPATSPSPKPTPTGTPSFSNASATTILSANYTTGVAVYGSDLWATYGTFGGSTFSLNESTTAGSQIQSIGAFGGTYDFNDIQCVNVGPDGSVYVADYGNNRFDVFNSAGVYQTTISVTAPANAVVNSAGTILYTLSHSAGVLAFSINNSTTPKTFTSATFTTTALFDSPQCIALDASGNIYVTNQAAPNFTEFSATGANPVTFGSAVLTEPTGIVVDGSGTVLVGNSSPAFIQEFTPSGSSYTAGVTFGNGLISSPDGMALDSSDNLYVADYGGERVLKFTNNH